MLDSDAPVSEAVDKMVSPNAAPNSKIKIKLEVLDAAWESGKPTGASSINRGGQTTCKRSRIRPLFRNSIDGITRGDIRRLARRGGVKRMSFEIYDYARYAVKEFLEKVILKASEYTEHGQRWTISSLDVVRALKSMGLTVYGYGA